MALSENSARLKGRAQRALGTQPVSDVIVRVRAIIGPTSIPQGETLAQAAFDKMHRGEEPTPDELSALEGVVRLLRPVVFSHNGLLDDLPTPPAGQGKLYPDELKTEWSTFKSSVAPVVPSIGRIELVKRGEHVGTGFLVAPGIVATNRHVVAVLTGGSE